MMMQKKPLNTSNPPTHDRLLTPHASLQASPNLVESVLFGLAAQARIRQDIKQQAKHALACHNTTTLCTSVMLMVVARVVAGHTRV